MERYNEYKDSGIFWEPSIPNYWRVTRLKNILSKLDRPRTPNDELLVCSNSGEVRKRGDNKLGLVADSDEIYQGVKSGDLLIHGMDTWHGAIAVSKLDGMCTPVVHVCDSSQKKEFVAIYLRNMASQKIFKLISNGVRQNTSDFRSWSKLGCVPIAIPPLAEQEKIVSYLESKTSKIDTYVADKEKEIQYLQELKQKTIAEAVTKGLNPNVKMKDSGISWLGMIPEHWEMRKLSQVSYEHFISNKTVHHQNLLSLSYGRIIRKDINKTEGLLPASFDTYQIVEDGNIVLRLTDLQNDQKSLRVGLAKEEGIVTSAYVCLGVYDSMIPAYLYNILHSYDIKKLFYSMGGGIRQGLNWQGLKKIDVPLPPLDEQRAIVAYIEEKCQKIDSLTTELQAEIDYLKEYKQRLIADVVTGQVSVQNEI